MEWKNTLQKFVIEGSATVHDALSGLTLDTCEARRPRTARDWLQYLRHERLRLPLRLRWQDWPRVPWSEPLGLSGNFTVWTEIDHDDYIIDLEGFTLTLRAEMTLRDVMRLLADYWQVYEAMDEFTFQKLGMSDANLSVTLHGDDMTEDELDAILNHLPPRRMAAMRG